MQSQQHQEEMEIDACVVAMGSYSARLLRKLGIRIPVYPAKGYSATMSICDDAKAPRSSVTDEAFKMVFTRLGQRLRIAGTAEFNGYELSLNPVRCAALIERAKVLFPGAAEYTQPTFWTGLRPATPSNRPLIGSTQIEGLYLNTGHGTLGWTEACGSSHALSMLIDGQQPDVEFDFLHV
jgi:D-amino-acid dehydrogenase